MKTKARIETNKTVSVELSDEDIIHLLVNNGTLPPEIKAYDVDVKHDNGDRDANVVNDVYPIIVSYTERSVIEDGEI